VILNKLMRERGGSSLAVGATKGAGLLRWLEQASSPVSSGETAAALSRALGIPAEMLPAFADEKQTKRDAMVAAIRRRGQ
jgi:hypothetical protein